MPTLPRPQQDSFPAIRQAIALAFDMIERAEPWRTIGATGQPAFANTWVNFGGVYDTAGYYKDVAGIVRLKGLVKNGTAPPSIIFTLPSGYRPGLQKIYPAYSAAALGFCEIKADGTVNAEIGAAASFSLEGISFRAA
jgi:hypothetical protein